MEGGDMSKRIGWRDRFPWGNLSGKTNHKPRRLK